MQQLEALVAEAEVGRQMQICNACRYCEGFCAVFPAMTRRLVADLVRRPVSRPGDPGPLDVLSEREREVLAEVARGKTNAEIGAALFMSPLTAKTHVSRILGKLNARDRAQLVVIGYETGLVSPGE